MSEYIERKALVHHLENCIDEVNNTNGYTEDFKTCLRLVKNQPAADVAEMKHGKWNGWHGDKLVGIDDNGDDMYRHYHYNTCSECGRGNAIKSAYCPHCGAKMGAEG